MSGPPRGRKAALVIVDVQNDFVSGSLAVPGADDVPAAVNRLRRAASWEVVAVTRDYHPAGHVSFHSTHAGRPGGAELFAEAELEDGTRQVMWPDHCVQGTRGAELVEELETDGGDLVVDKGLDKDVDSYSAFFDNRRRGETCLRERLRSAGVTDVYVCGLAFDYCVGFTALDAASLGFRTRVVVDATRAVAPESEARMRARLAAAGVALLHVASVESGNYGPRADAEDYLARHGVQAVLEHLCARLVLERPADARAFMAAELDRIAAGERGKAPVLLDTDDVNHAFAALDPAKTGRVTGRQAAVALEHMGASPKDVPAPAGEVTREQFLDMARSVGVV